MTVSFISGDSSVEVVRYQPKRDGQFPALIVLHGSNGPVSSFVGDYAQQLADLGFVVYFLHYFDRTGTTYASYSEITTQFPAWMETITDCIHFAQQDAKVDGDRIGLL